VKQTLFMIAMTLVGSVGVFTRGPIYGVVVYYLFAVLRPQYMWKWSLPEGIQWSLYVALPTIASVLLGGSGTGRAPRPWTVAHKVVLLFAVWVVLSFANAFDKEFASIVFTDYLKIFLMFFIASAVIREVAHLWIIMLLTAAALGYISYEVNYLYFVNNYLGIYRNGYGGLDNNGAGLMLAMGVPLCMFAWEGMRHRLRWAFLALVPAIVHAVLMTYSRGAMLSLIVAWPLMVARSRYRVRIALASVAFAVLAVPVMAGPEIQARFFTIKDNEVDDSANQRRKAWAAAWKIACDYPILGVGVRNANLFSYQYGADTEGRTIHSQYLQIAADCGFVGIGLYLAIFLCVAVSTHGARRAARRNPGPDADRVRAIASGVECSLFLFLFGAFFLSLEVFELPYVLLLLGAQLPVVYSGQTSRLATSPHHV
jgi:probable O-glycosylation ligase (exosortase A-associated)